MERTPFSIFDQCYKRRLEYIQEERGLSCSTDIPPSPEPPQPPKPDPFCLSDKIIKTARPEACDRIEEEHKLSSAALYITNQPAIVDCYNIPAGVKLCLPPSCKDIYVLQPEDTGRSIVEKHYEQSRGIAFGSLFLTYNPWVSPDYSNLPNGSTTYGCVLCLGPPNGFHTKGAPLHGNPTISTSRLGQVWTYETPPEDCQVAEATTQECGKWHKAQPGDSCAQLAMSNIITSKLLLVANPSLGRHARECEDRIIVGKT